ncbi:hypothetical protein [Ephemeroptericola cinctiostellae]|nr:hypothetical protein [Ephemeroptericola cinctiostellae]
MMSIPHAVSGQVLNILPAAHELGAKQSTALFKSQELEVIRLILPKDKTMPTHQVAGEITVQCVSGSIEMICNGDIQVLNSGQLLYLSGGVAHSLSSREDAVVLLTIVLHR